MSDSHFEWQGYRIKRGERNMLWVTKDGVNPMPGACCFARIEDAKKGIAALILTDLIIGDRREKRGDVFWMLMELSR